MKSSILTESTSTLVHLDDLTFDPYLVQSEILTGVKTIASEINNDYQENINDFFIFSVTGSYQSYDSDGIKLLMLIFICNFYSSCYIKSFST